MAKLGEVCKVSPSTKNIERQGAWLLNLDMVEQQTGRVIEYKYVGEDDLNGSIIQFDTENVLYSKLRPNLNKVVLPQKDGFSTSELLPLRPDARVLNRDYLAVFLRSDSFVTWAVSKTAGAKMPRLGTKDLMSAEIPVPTIEQQKKIAEKFKKLEQLISLRKQQLAKLNELVKARFVEMFGDPVTNPKGYEKYKLENLARKISDGVHSKPDYTETGRPFLSVVNINKGVINFKNCKYVSEDAYQKMIKSTHPERGDVLYTKVGATYGIPAYVDTDIAFCLYVSVCLIKPKREVINPRFLSLSMEMPYVKHQADRRIKGIGVPDLHLNQISEFEILCPPLKEQDIFIYFVERLDGEKRVVQQSLEKLELMKKALMQEYFG